MRRISEWLREWDFGSLAVGEGTYERSAKVGTISVRYVSYMCVVLNISQWREHTQLWEWSMWHPKTLTLFTYINNTIQMVVVADTSRMYPSIYNEIDIENSSKMTVISFYNRGCVSDVSLQLNFIYKIKTNNKNYLSHKQWV